jgi:hypothetical protein
MPSIPVRQSGGAVTFSVRVHARTRRDGISGVVGDSLKLDLTAPPIEGQANDACIRFFAEFLKVPRSSVTIAAGTSSRNKVIRVQAVSADEVETAIERALSVTKREEPKTTHDS